jgi:2-polyprenyl-6-methoxyphenol hydroxylase-like FAD-dependent oxidoreductase
VLIFRSLWVLTVGFRLQQYAQMEALEDLAETEPERVQIIKKAAVTKLIKEGDSVVGVEYTHDGETHKAYGPVVIATGKFRQRTLQERRSPRPLRWIRCRFFQGRTFAKVPTRPHAPPSVIFAHSPPLTTLY